MPSWALPPALLLAKAGELPPSFFHERTSETLPCQGTNKFFCWDWAKQELIPRYGTPTLQHLNLVAFAVVIVFEIAFAVAIRTHRRHWLQPPMVAATGVLY